MASVVGRYSSLFVLLVVAGCGHDSSSSPPPTVPPVVATREVTVLEDDRCYHLGDEFRREFCANDFSQGFIAERRWVFTVTSQPIEGRLTLHVVDLGPIGAEVHLNGTRVMTLPPPLGDGSVAGPIAGSAFRIGSNELRIRPRAERPDLIEDFQLDQVRLVVTVPA